MQNLPLVSPDDLPRFVAKVKYSFDRVALECYWKTMMENVKKACDENVSHIWRQGRLDQLFSFYIQFIHELGYVL